MKKPVLVVLNSDNPSRIHHLEKVSSYRSRFKIIFVVDAKTSIGSHLPYCDEVLQIGAGNLSAEFALLAGKIDQPAFVLNLSEFMVPLHALFVEHFAVLGLGMDQAEISRDKFKMREFCKSIEIPIPQFIQITSHNLNEVHSFKFPVICKPAMGGGSALVRRFDSAEELENSFPEMSHIAAKMYATDPIGSRAVVQFGEPTFLVEELIGGEVLFKTDFPYTVGEISVESVFDGENVQVIAIHDKPLPSNGPYFEEFIWSTPSRISEQLQLKAKKYVERIHKALGPGALVLHTEFRTMKDDLVILEFGARLGGAAVYRSVLHSTNIDMIDVLIQIGMGEKLDRKPQAPIPTISHALWASQPGQLLEIVDLPEGSSSPAFVEVLMLDAVGDKVQRSPTSTRAHGHVVYQSQLGFDFVETELIKALNSCWLRVDGQMQKPAMSNRI